MLPKRGFRSAVKGGKRYRAMCHLCCFQHKLSSLAATRKARIELDGSPEGGPNPLIAKVNYNKVDPVTPSTINHRRHMSQYQRNSPMNPLVLLCSIGLLVAVPPVSAQGFGGEVTLNSTKTGTTEGIGSGGYDKFASPSVGGGGQVYYTLTIPDGPVWDVSISTCESATFDTYLILFHGKEPNATHVVGENDNDETCTAGNQRSKVIATLKPSTYSILVTGTGLAQGKFTLSVTAAPSGIPWSLDRIDQRNLPLDGRYTVSEKGSDGDGITVYVLDSGIRDSHTEFEGRVRQGFDFVRDKPASGDCTGFGTHAAGIIAGKTHGVAKKATLVSVPILDCENKATTAWVTGALEWIILDVQSQPQKQIPAIIFMRFHASSDLEVNKAVRAIVNFGIPVIAPAGDNDSGDYCTTTSPADADVALMVGSIDQRDFRSSFSNFGSCTNLYAPGNGIESASSTGDTAYTVQSGTALAAAHVAGVTSILMSMNRGVKPRDMRAILTSLGTVDVVKNATGTLQPGAESDTNDQDSSRLVFVRSVPRILDDIPPVDSIFVYFVLQYDPDGTKKCDSLAITNKWSDILAVPESNIRSSCSEELTSDEATAPNAIYRVSAEENKAAAVSSTILRAIKDDKDASVRKIGSAFEVVEEPWFVDSNAFTFWGEPQFEKIDSPSLTAGVIAGIVAAGLLLLVVVCVFGYAIRRHCIGVDDIESMEGSADFEKAPVHFDDFAGARQARESSASAVGRSFRNVFDGIGRSMSMRGLGRQSSRRGGPDVSGQEISRMDSYVGEVRGAEQGGGTDILRMKSYGGEAFAGLGGIQRSNSMMSQTSNSTYGAPPGGGSKGGSGPDGDQRVASFRGMGQLMGGLNRQGSEMNFEAADNDGPASMGDVRMHSMGGEAFAMIGQGSRSIAGGYGGGSKERSTLFGDGERGRQEQTQQGRSAMSDVPQIRPQKTNASGAEALAAVSDDTNREPSFFGGRRNGLAPVKK